MRKSSFTEAQIIGMIKEQEAGLPTAELCWKHARGPATCYKLKAEYGKMDLSHTKCLKQLEEENANPSCWTKASPPSTPSCAEQEVCSADLFA